MCPTSWANRPAHSADEEHECSESGSTKPYAAQVRFLSRGGQRFMAMAKNKAWDKDLYNDLAGLP